MQNDITKKVLVTGGAGYIGSHTVHTLVEDGYEPIVIDTLEKGSVNFLPKNTLFYEGNINDSALIEKIYSENPFDKVIHFAAYIEAGESMKDPLKFFENNTAASAMFFNSLQRLGVKKLIFSSTAAVYGVPELIPIREEANLKPINYYGLSKLMIEQVLESCEVAYDWKSIRLRYFNAAGAGYDIGENHSPETHLIPIILQAATGEREKVVLYGTDYSTQDGTCVRDYIHVLDLAAAHVKALKALEGGVSGVFNVGLGKGFSVREIIDMCKKVTGVDFLVEEEDRRPGDPDSLIANTNKIQSELGWQPKYGLREIVESAWKWHQTK